MNYEAGAQGYDNYVVPSPSHHGAHGWSPYVHQEPYQQSNDWGAQTGWGQTQGTFMDLLIGPSTTGYEAGSSGYGQDSYTHADSSGYSQNPYTYAGSSGYGQDLYTQAYTQGCDYPSTRDPGDLTQEQPSEPLPNFMSRLSGQHYVRRSTRANRGKAPDPVYRTLNF
jgi:hypothetical protein